MPRLTRTESQSRNRELLVASARRLFLRDGYATTSLAAVAAEAGFSTGVVYSNVAGKADLALLVLRQIEAEQIDALEGALGAAADPEAKLDAFGAWAEEALSSGWPQLELEFALDARSDQRLVAEEAQRHDLARELAERALAQLLPPSVVPLLPAAAVAEALVNLVIGVSVRRLIDPSVSYDSMLGPLRDLLRAFAPAESR